MGPANVRINPVGGAVFIALGVCAALYMFGLPDWFHREPRVSMKELLSVCIQLAQEGGKRVKDVRLASNELAENLKGKTDEGVKDVKTEGDTQSHRAIVYGLAKAFPGLKVISEEKDLKPVNLLEIKDTNKHLTEVAETISSDQSISNSKITVWVDPLDATKEYTEKKLEYVATMVCVAVDGHPTIGVIHKPFVNDNKGETVWAWVGYGKSKTLEAVKTEKKEGDPDRIIVSISHKGDVESVAKAALGEKTQVLKGAGAGYKTLEVIKGNADAYLHTTKIKKWDLCAANAILSSMDGKMTTLQGDFIDYSSTTDKVVSDGLLVTLSNHFDYLKKLAGAMKKSDA
ncbi:putative inositol monophosphatase 3 [Mytilus californianus]|uniref:putative inositol monophosphatase 3 n=1 Tax=Mytilus californianus TaxID=6549 RepID=UPI00224805A5|nr:putative inositol monophosphatase 3 [Mytilus californianus]